MNGAGIQEFVSIVIDGLLLLLVFPIFLVLFPDCRCLLVCLFRSLFLFFLPYM
jgi:hypothetical protein